jgi:hypothetical protein
VSLSLCLCLCLCLSGPNLESFVKGIFGENQRYRKEQKQTVVAERGGRKREGERKREDGAGKTS